MPDRDEVIKAIEACMDQNHPAYCNECYLDGFRSETTCREKLMRDALALLRVQETTWVREEDRMNHWHCEKCGFVEGITSRFHKYCPNCGRKVKR